MANGRETRHGLNPFRFRSAMNRNPRGGCFVLSVRAVKLIPAGLGTIADGRLRPAGGVADSRFLAADLEISAADQREDEQP